MAGDAALHKLGRTGLNDEHDERAPLPATRVMSRNVQMRWLAIAGLAFLAVLLIVGIGHWFAAPEPAPEASGPTNTFKPTRAQLAQMTIVPAREGAVADLVRATGAIAVNADRSTPVVLPFSAQVLDVLVEAGQRVARGQPLLRVASGDLVDARNALLQSGAQAASAEAAVRVAEANARRQQLIVDNAGGALKDLQQAQADLAVAQSSVRTAQAAQTAARNKLALFGGAGGASGDSAGVTFRAPAGGVIADRNVAPGQFVGAAATAPLMTITDLSRVWLIAQLPESEAESVHLGDQVTVTTPALPGREFSARVDNIAASLDPVTHRLPVRATVSNPAGELKPQMFASFTIRRVLHGGAGVLVPAAAVIHEGDTARIWVLRPDGTLAARDVRTGETEGGFTRITAGLREGERVVSGGALFVNEAGLEG